ncbi:hypothetical protein, partial [Acinetobacter bereziniae]|uniref:hypothetical protein n=1 Tax=Acinetobacter bereziniae TaxID=106648 RepID=UPI001250C1D6
MSSFYKYLIFSVLFIVVVVGCLVRKDLDNKSEIKHTLITEDVNELNKNVQNLNEEEFQDIRKLMALSNANLTEEEVENLKKTAGFLNFKYIVEKFLNMENPDIEPQDFNELLRDLDRLREENYFFLGEAYAIKLKLLKAYYVGDILERKVDELIAETKAIDAKERSSYNPLDDPKFKIFKEKEKRIIEQANTMTSFPNGISKDEY